ncbi:apoptosis-antagonizing transcription factor [Cristinia sonorae]|uniref:Protein BFR2 n=1 Tax=Cristinia sonorae TaxID=1940300 RepID=A0A8K0XJD3_9AGAR|nr:apoptosis-antagonizing transcription factor [Cristinia sonorae]
MSFTQVLDGQHDPTASLRETREQDRRKGLAISHQIAIWNALMDARIQLQKILTATNKLPVSSPHPGSSNIASPSVLSVVEEAYELSRELLILQSSLYKADDLDLNVPAGPSNTESVEDTLCSWSSTVSEAEAVHAPHLVQTLSKWSTKIQIAAPNFALGTKSSALKTSSLGQTSNVVSIIRDHLETDSEELLARTRTVPSREHDVDHDTFGDMEFYQQLLRDVIESKASTGGSTEQGWLHRQATAKRNKIVDTKASKGRKLRYEVHEKLQHFMIPIPVVVGGWPDEQVDELFGSLVDK